MTGTKQRIECSPINDLPTAPTEVGVAGGARHFVTASILLYVRVALGAGPHSVCGEHPQHALQQISTALQTLSFESNMLRNISTALQNTQP